MPNLKRALPWRALSSTQSGDGSSRFGQATTCELAKREAFHFVVPCYDDLIQLHDTVGQANARDLARYIKCRADREGTNSMPLAGFRCTHIARYT